MLLNFPTLIWGEGNFELEDKKSEIGRHCLSVEIIWSVFSSFELDQLFFATIDDSIKKSVLFDVKRWCHEYPNIVRFKRIRIDLRHGELWVMLIIYFQPQTRIAVSAL